MLQRLRRNSHKDGRGIRETVGINDRRAKRPGDANDGRHAVKLDKPDRELIVVDLGSR